jgi:UDP-glucuronate 4-epimerase
MAKKILVTGLAGFIGYHLSKMLVDRGDHVIGIDIINDYYDRNLKFDRLATLGLFPEKTNQKIKSKTHPNLSFYQTDICKGELVDQIIEEHKPDVIVNLAAQAGVRYSLVNPKAYIDSNINGYFNLINSAKTHNVGHFVYASSSSVYGLNKKMPLSVSDNVDHPVSLYAATKKSNELIAHSYSHLYNLPTTGLRFFTVYGPWGRPDMALFLFASAILENRPIDVYNYGKMQRDFTYIDDIVKGVIRVIDNPPSGDLNWDGEQPNPATSRAPYRVFNIGNNKPVLLMDFIEIIEEELGKKAKKNLMEIQPGDVEGTWADVTQLNNILNYNPSTDLRVGIRNFLNWYKEYYKVEV